MQISLQLLSDSIRHEVRINEIKTYPTLEIVPLHQDGSQIESSLLVRRMTGLCLRINSALELPEKLPVPFF